MSTVGGLLINLTLNTAGLTGGLLKAEAELKAFAAQMNGTSATASKGFPMIAAGATLAGLAMIGFAVASVKAATEFEYQMRMIETQAGASVAEVNRMSAAVLQLSSEGVQAGPISLAKGLYHIESVGIRGAQALDILKIAAQGAAVGNAGLEEVTNALLAAVVSGIDGVTDMSGAMGTLNGIVGQGNMRMQDLADSLSSGILATARTFGLSLQDVGAAMATMTDQGIPAEEAATRLRITIALIGAPTKIAATELKSIGISATQLADDMRKPNGLVIALRELSAHLKSSGLTASEQAAVLKTAFGGSRSSAGILTLINSIDLMDLKLKMIKKSSGSFAEDFLAESQTARASFSNLGAAVEVLMVRIGNTLIPIFKSVADIIAKVAGNTAILVFVFDAALSVITVLAGRALLLLAVKLYAIAAPALTLGVRFGFLAAAATFTTLSLAGMGPMAIVAAVGVGALTIAVKLLQATLTFGLSLIITSVLTGIIMYSKQVTQTVREVILNVLGLLADFASNLKGIPVIGGAITDKGIQSIRDNRVGLLKEYAITARELKEEAGKASLGGTDEQNYQDMLKGVGAMNQAVKDGTGPIIDSTKSLVDTFGTTIAGVEQAARFAGEGSMLEMAKGIAEKQNAPIQAYDDLVKMLQTPFNKMKELAFLYGEATSSDIAKGLANGDAKIVAQTVGLTRLIEARWQELTGESLALGLGAGSAFTKGVTAGGVEIVGVTTDIGINAQTGLSNGLMAALAKPENSAKITGKRIIGVWDAVAADAYAPGSAATTNLSSGMTNGVPDVIIAATKVATPVVNILDQVAAGAAYSGKNITLNLAAGITDPVNVAKLILALRQIVIPVAKILDETFSKLGMGSGTAMQDAFQSSIDALNKAASTVTIIDTTGSKSFLQAALSDPNWSKYIGAFGDHRRSLDKVAEAAGNAGDALRAMAADAKAAMTDAFSKIKDAARSFFDKLHEQNLKSISESHERARKALEDQKLINEGPARKAQASLDASKARREKDRLFADIQNAKTPEEHDTAVQAMNDFQAEQNILLLESQAEEKNKSIDAQIEADKKLETSDKASENKRYNTQVKEFNDTLASLKSYLSRHPEEWKKVQNQIVALLNKYGINYKVAGALMGRKFVDGIESQIKNAEAAAKKLAAAGVPKTKKEKVPPVVVVPGGAPAGTNKNDISSEPLDESGEPIYALGAWRIPRNQLAFLHANEMVVPASAADTLRRIIGSGGLSGLSRLMSGGAEPWPGGAGGVGGASTRIGSSGASQGVGDGGGTIVVQVGDDVIARIVDKRLWVRGNLSASGA